MSRHKVSPITMTEIDNHGESIKETNISGRLQAFIVLWCELREEGTKKLQTLPKVDEIRSDKLNGKINRE